MIQELQLVAIFCEIDDFCMELDKNISESLLSEPTRKGEVQIAVCRLVK